MATPFKMKGHTLPGIKQRPSAKIDDGRAKSSAFQKDTDPVEKSASDKQTIVDLANIKASSNQPIKGSATGDYKETVKSIKRQNRIDASNLSRKEVKKKLKSRSKQGGNLSKKQDTSWLKRTFGSTKNLQSDLAHQQNVSDIDIKGKPQ